MNPPSIQSLIVDEHVGPVYHRERQTMTGAYPEGCDVLTLPLEELEQWAARPLVAASPNDIERIVWARCWLEPERARERCAAELHESLCHEAARAIGRGEWRHRSVASAMAELLAETKPSTQDRVTMAWLRAVSALEEHRP